MDGSAKSQRGIHEEVLEKSQCDVYAHVSKKSLPDVQMNILYQGKLAWGYCSYFREESAWCSRGCSREVCLMF